MSPPAKADASSAHDAADGQEESSREEAFVAKVASGVSELMLCDQPRGPWPCGLWPQNCVVSSERMMSIFLDDVRNGQVVKIVCSNESCPRSQYCHQACFAAFEESILTHLKAQAKGNKALSDKQKAQKYIWTKRGYELVFAACQCSCKKGHIRKDLDWTSTSDAPETKKNLLEASSEAHTAVAGPGKRKRKKSSRNKAKPALTIGLPALGMEHVSSRNRSYSLGSNSSNNSSSSRSSSCPASPCEQQRQQLNQQPPRRALLQDRSRHDSGGSIFSRRPDYSAFDVLPRNKVNSYHIKIEDECSIGNDETRSFILSSYATNRMNRVPCVLCKAVLPIFDRYPLIDGTFFLSPKQHGKNSIAVRNEGKPCFLTAVCMFCLEGWTGGGFVCRFCCKPWNGAHLILGTMYSYDIFAAMPCCQEKLKCNNCCQLVVHADQRLPFFSDYSQMVSCPHCGVQDAHFAKNASTYVRADEMPSSSSATPFNAAASSCSTRQSVQRVHSA